MEQIVDIIVNNGIAVGVILYFMYSNERTMREVSDALKKVNESLIKLIEHISRIGGDSDV